MEGKIFAVTVTYGNRFHLLKRVIEAALREGVHKVIVVDNNSDKQSREKLMDYHAKNKKKVEVLYLPENLGSAGGFKRGLELAYRDPECEFIWLLDDDNMPCEGSLRVLKEFWEKNINETKKLVALLSYRKNRGKQIESLVKKDPNLVLGKKNSFYGFHILSVPVYIKDIFARKLNKEEKGYRDSCIPSFGEVAVAPYGGLFFNKKLLEIIGYPNEEFYVYVDDHDWTRRVTWKGGRIILLMDSRIKDLDESWHITEKSNTMLASFLPSNAFRIYYSLRNRVYFEDRYMKTSDLIYTINYLTFLALVLLHDIIFFKTVYTFKISLKAFRDGREGKLGKNHSFSS